MEKVSKVIGPINVTMREVLGQALKQAHIDKKLAEERLSRARATVRLEERELSRLDDRIVDLSDALGEEEAARWDID